MHGKDKIGHITIKEKFIPVAVSKRTFTFFYHGERICRAKFQKLGVDALIEFYNGDLPIALQGKVSGATTREITASR